MQNIALYIILGLCAAGAIYGIIVGMDKMIRLILANYILGSIVLATGLSMQKAITFLQASPNLSSLGMSYESLANILQNAQLTILVLLYIILLIIVSKKSNIHAYLPSNLVVQNIVYVLILPLLVSSILCIATLIVFTTGAMSLDTIALAPALSRLPTVVNNIPIRILLHSLLTLIVTSEVKFSFPKSTSSTPIS